MPAGCEGDLVSLTGMVLIKALTGKIPWMANLAGIKDGKVWFSHCTVPFNLIDSYEINTHYETGKGMAVQGEMPAGPYTVFRMSVDFQIAFVAEGEIKPEPRIDEACRTQVVIDLDSNDYQELKSHPLGNHHLLVPGRFKEILWKALGYLNISQRKISAG
jgi:L-fucose isomerase-like protein